MCADQSPTDRSIERPDTMRAHIVGYYMLRSFAWAALPDLGDRAYDHCVFIELHSACVPAIKRVIKPSSVASALDSPEFQFERTPVRRTITHMCESSRSDTLHFIRVSWLVAASDHGHIVFYTKFRRLIAIKRCVLRVLRLQSL